MSRINYKTGGQSVQAGNANKCYMCMFHNMLAQAIHNKLYSVGTRRDVYPRRSDVSLRRHVWVVNFIPEFLTAPVEISTHGKSLRWFYHFGLVTFANK